MPAPGADGLRLDLVEDRVSRRQQHVLDRLLVRRVAPEDGHVGRDVQRQVSIRAWSSAGRLSATT
jgi:hypothetical protein